MQLVDLGIAFDDAGGKLAVAFGDRARDECSGVGGSIGLGLFGCEGAARALKKHKVSVVELHHREDERRADSEQ
jgi:hypothetical protein